MEDFAELIQMTVEINRNLEDFKNCKDEEYIKFYTDLYVNAFESINKIQSFLELKQAEDSFYYLVENKFEITDRESVTFDIENEIEMQLEELRRREKKIIDNRSIPSDKAISQLRKIYYAKIKAEDKLEEVMNEHGKASYGVDEFLEYYCKNSNPELLNYLDEYAHRMSSEGFIYIKQEGLEPRFDDIKTNYDLLLINVLEAIFFDNFNLEDIIYEEVWQQKQKAIHDSCCYYVSNYEEEIKTLRKKYK